MTSNVHMAWMRVVCSRMKSDYRYTPAVYNNFPWPTPTDAQKAKIEQTAQAILDAGIDFVSASRPFICQPDFVQHLEKGEDSPCIGCTKCLGNIWAKEGRRCVKHPIPPEFATQA